MSAALELTPVDVNYLSSKLVYDQLINNQKTATLAPSGVSSPTPPEVVLDGQGRAALQGSITITTATPSAGMLLLTLPPFLQPTKTYYFPVVVLRSGAYVTNAVALAGDGAPVTAVTVTNQGNYASLPTVTALGPGTGATFQPVMKALSAAIVAAGSGYAPGDGITLAGGTSTTKAVLNVVNTRLVSTVLNAIGSGYAPGNNITLAGGVATSPAVLNVLTTQLAATAINAAGTGYLTGDTVTLAGGTASTKAVVTLTSTKLVSTVLNAAGLGYAVNDTITLAGGTSSIQAVIKVLSVGGGGAISTFSILTPGSYTVESSSFTQASTSGAGTGATFQSSLFGVLTFNITTRGSYTVNTPTFTQFSTTGSGTGATFQSSLFGVHTFSISIAGVYTTNTTTFTQASTTGAGSGATFNTSLFGVNSTTVSTVGSYTALPSNPVTQFSTTGAGSGATFTVRWAVLSITVTAMGSGYTSASNLFITGGGGNPSATGFLVLGTSNIGKLTMVNAPNQNDIVQLDGVDFLVNTYEV